MSTTQQPEALAELRERLRGLETDHAPDGWPAVRMRDITALLDDLDNARSDNQVLRLGYAAARLEIESLRKEHADELAVAYMCRASREKELAVQQPGAAYAALSDAEIDRIVPALEPVSEDFPVEWALWKDRGRIRNELRAPRVQAPAQAAPAAVTGANDSSITLDLKMASKLLDMFGGVPGLVTLQHGGEKCHSGAGLYAWYSDLQEEGAVFLGAEPDDEAAPTTQPSPQLPERDASVPAEQQGLFRKFDVRRVDGTDKPGGKHHGCTYFVLDVDHDPCARPALAAYAAACEATHPALAADLLTKWGAAPTAQPAPQQEAQEPVAVIGADFTIFWAGHGPIAPIVERHALKVGSPLYAAPQPLPAAQGDALTQAARDVLAERQRQISAEGWTPEHDDEHDLGQLARAAAAYAAQSRCAEDAELSCEPTIYWPWHRKWWKPNSRRGMLVKAGALILAEMERMDRADAARAAQEGKSHDN